VDRFEFNEVKVAVTNEGGSQTVPLKFSEGFTSSPDWHLRVQAVLRTRARLQVCWVR
jgi:hypothetical protein